ncbi:MAG: SDR family NAD(P)-dependent oxidoreductase [Pseudomonadota bacterium]
MSTMDTLRHGNDTTAERPVSERASDTAPQAAVNQVAPGSEKLGRVAWVIGASSGIGRNVAERLAQEGMAVAASARSEDALAELANTSDRLHSYPLDVTDEEAIAETLDAIEREIGPIDLAVFCAATWSVMDVEELEVAPIQKGMAVNFNGTVAALVPLAHRMMKRKNGRLAIVASVAGYRGLPRSVAYGPTKAALINLAESLQPDLARHNVDVSIINPGFVDTPMTKNNDFPMPFLQTVEEAGEKIVDGLKRGRYEIAFPWQLVTILKLLRRAPNSLFLWMMRKFVARSPEARAKDERN